MTTVNEVNMAKWIVALRSGKYQQWRGQLRSGGGSMCCLGVLCEISGIGRWQREGADISYLAEGDFRGSLPPAPVMEWAGLDDPNPTLGSTTCANANDLNHWDFPRIAAALESWYLPGKKAEEILGASDVR